MSVGRRNGGTHREGISKSGTASRLSPLPPPPPHTHTHTTTTTTTTTAHNKHTKIKSHRGPKWRQRLSEEEEEEGKSRKKRQKKEKRITHNQ